MELTKKLISLTMAVIMTVTATPVLQASDLVNLDMTELNELRQEILPSITDPNNFITNGETEEMPTLKELQDRYKEVIKRYKKLNTRKARKAVEKKKQEALEIANQMKEFDEFIDEDEKAEVACPALWLAKGHFVGGGVFCCQGRLIGIRASAVVEDLHAAIIKRSHGHHA